MEWEGRQGVGDLELPKMVKSPLSVVSGQLQVPAKRTGVRQMIGGRGRFKGQESGVRGQRKAESLAHASGWWKERFARPG